MTTTTPTRDRQTHTRVLHPQRGPGVATFRNGPSRFTPESGPSVDMPIDLGGVSSQPRRSWVVARDPEHGRVELDIVEPGEHWTREWSPFFGLGWLGGPPGHDRFEADDGRVIALPWVTMAVGTPAYAEKVRRARSRMPAEGPDDRNWRTLTLATGEVMAFRRDGPPPEAT